MRPHQLKALIAVAEHGSIRAAAHSLYLSQAALTKAIKELEEEMSASLVTRTTHGVHLTDEGKVLYTHALAIVAEIRGAREDIERIKGGSAGIVTAAISPLPSVTLLPAAYRAFRTQLPDARLNLIEGNFLHSMPKLREGALDFVVVGVFDGEMTDEFASTELFSDDFALVCRRGHPLERAQSITELYDNEWILYSANPDYTDVMTETLAEAGIMLPRRLIRCSSLTLILSLLARSDMIVTLPASVLDAPWAAPLLTRIHVRERIPRLTVRIFTRRKSPLAPPAQVMVTCLCNATRDYLARRSSGLVSDPSRNLVAEAFDEKVDERTHRR